jgi:folate-binding protein YgfZ
MICDSFPIKIRISKQMIPLPYLSAIRFSGADAGDFLHNQLSSDVLALANNESVFACYCEPKGRVLALMLVCHFDGSYYIVMSSALAPAVTCRLKIYVMRSKVSIEVLDEFTVTGLCSDEMPESPSVSIPVIPVPEGNQWFVMTSDLQVQNEDIAAQDNWKMSELQRGISWLCPETSGQFLPQMLGFDKIGAVNFKKGCYPGQEIVARTHYLGKVKRHPRILCTNAVICPDPLEKIQISSGDQFYDAIITDCAHGEDGKNCLFVITRMDPELTADKFEYQGLIAPL